MADIETIDGVAAADVEAVNGVAKANIQAINGCGVPAKAATAKFDTQATQPQV